MKSGMRRKSCLSLMALSALMISAASADKIRIDDNPDRWTINTENSSYQVALTADKNLDCHGANIKS